MWSKLESGNNDENGGEGNEGLRALIPPIVGHPPKQTPNQLVSLLEYSTVRPDLAGHEQHHSPDSLDERAEQLQVGGDLPTGQFNLISGLSLPDSKLPFGENLPIRKGKHQLEYALLVYPTSHFPSPSRTSSRARFLICYA